MWNNKFKKNNNISVVFYESQSIANVKYVIDYGLCLIKVSLNTIFSLCTEIKYTIKHLFLLSAIIVNNLFIQNIMFLYSLLTYKYTLYLRK